MSDETSPSKEPFVPTQSQPPSADQLEALWEQEQAVDFDVLREGLAAVLHPDL